MEERSRFIWDLESGSYTMTDLCVRYGISRKTGYKWAERFVAGGVLGLQDRSRAAHRCPHRTEASVAAALIAARRKHPRWGPRKLVSWLARRSPEMEWPSRSTVGDILRRQGLVEPHRRRHVSPAVASSRTEAVAPNVVWTGDYKGQFRTGDGRWCYPLTVVDAHSRFLLGCEGLASTDQPSARRVFEGLFQRYGLPEVIRTDNGSPFASTSVGRLSRLSVYWIRLGIRPERIDPGKPQQNASHERMHRTLKAETARPPAADATAQQHRFRRFQREFNHERPHESLDDQPPARFYQPSLRPYPKQLPTVEYPGHFDVRSVRGDGFIKWKGRLHFLSEALAGERVGLEEIDEGIWALSFAQIELVRLNERDLQREGA